MTPRQIARARADIRALRLRLGNVKRRELVALARLAGRTCVARGDEPLYEKQGRPPLSIPGHEGTMKAKKTVLSVLKVIEADVDWEEERS